MYKLTYLHVKFVRLYFICWRTDINAKFHPVHKADALQSRLWKYDIITISADFFIKLVPLIYLNVFSGQGRWSWETSFWPLITSVWRTAPWRKLFRSSSSVRSSSNSRSAKMKTTLVSLLSLFPKSKRPSDKPTFRDAHSIINPP